MSRLFLGGIPTAPDVKKLRTAFPEIKEGDQITHEQVEAVLKLDAKSSRYRSITTSWRKELLNELNLELAALPTIGYRCLPAGERLTTNIKGFRQGTRKQGKSVRRVIMIEAEKLSDVDQAKQLHMMRLGQAVVAQATSVMKELNGPKASEQISLLRKPPVDAGPAQP